ncbi:MAG: haloacid dehalogenase [Anaerolineales bacterium]
MTKEKVAALQSWLDDLVAAADEDFEARNDVREAALTQSRRLIKLCSSAIRSGHREAWDEADDLLAQADELGAKLQEMLAPYPDLYYAGYTQDALKELVEAHITLVLISERPLPLVAAINAPYPAYLNGVCEAASELRRRCLDLMRRERMDEAENLLAMMDAVYEVLMSFGYPDAITGGLRRRVDQLRGVLERTRGDLTNSYQMQRLLKALETFEEQVS